MQVEGREVVEGSEFEEVEEMIGTAVTGESMKAVAFFSEADPFLNRFNETLLLELSDRILAYRFSEEEPYCVVNGQYVGYSDMSAMVDHVIFGDPEETMFREFRLATEDEIKRAKSLKEILLERIEALDSPYIHIKKNVWDYFMYWFAEYFLEICRTGTKEEKENPIISMILFTADEPWVILLGSVRNFIEVLEAFIGKYKELLKGHRELVPFD